MMEIRKQSDKLHPITYSVAFEVNVLHGHAFREITYFIEGEALDIINGKIYSAKKCTLVFLGPMHAHKYKVKSNKYEHRDIYVDEDEFKKICDLLDNNIYANFCDAENPVFLTLTEDYMMSLDTRLRMLQLFEPDNIEPEHYAVHRSIVCDLIGRYVENQISFKSPYPQWLQHLLAEMQKTEIICGSFSDLVKTSNYSAGHLSREFKKIMHISPSEYHAQLKIKHAVSLLENTDKSILDISLEIGYQSLSHFIHRFKAAVGMSPSAYRKAMKRKE